MTAQELLVELLKLEKHPEFDAELLVTILSDSGKVSGASLLCLSELEGEMVVLVA